MHRRGFFYAAIATRDGVRIPQVGLGVHVDVNAQTFRKAPPRFGEDSEDVLRTWLDMNADECEKLHHDGVIWSGVRAPILPVHDRQGGGNTIELTAVDFNSVTHRGARVDSRTLSLAAHPFQAGNVPARSAG